MKNNVQYRFYRVHWPHPPKGGRTVRVVHSNGKRKVQETGPKPYKETRYADRG